MQELYNEWIVKDHRHVLAVLEDLPSVKPPIDHMCELLPKLQARYYSISSSPKVCDLDPALEPQQLPLQIWKPGPQ